MIRIFLAHASENKEAVINLYDRLQEKGFQPWLDKKDLLPGQNWRSEIPRAIQNSDICLACLSQQSVIKKGYVQKEFKLALSKCAEMPTGKIYLIPLRLDACEIPELRQEDYGVNLRDLQWVNYFETDGFDMLVRSIDSYFPTSKEDATPRHSTSGGDKYDMRGTQFGGGYVAGNVEGTQIREGRENARRVENVLKASQEYNKNYEARHGQIKTMLGPMKDSIPLDSIYTAVKFLDDRSRRYFAPPDGPEQLYRNQNKRSFQTTNIRHDGMSIAQEERYLTVLGEPGTGKSTFLKKLGLEALKGQEGQFKRDQTPVFLELKTFRDESIDLVAKIAKEFAICGFPDSEAFTVESLKQGKLLLLLDGLDEIPSHNMSLVMEKIEDFATQYKKNTIVTSCRTAAYRSSLKQFTNVTIADFDDKQIKQFIHLWFQSEIDQQTETAKHYWELLQQPQNKAAKELAQTPLLLTVLCSIYDREKRLPNQRSALYKYALDLLLSEWTVQKRLERAPIYENLHPELEKESLSEIAYTSFKEDRLFFSQSDITNRITTYLAKTLGAPEYLNGLAILKAIEVQQGILVERAVDTYSFSHLTLQEYLTALYISKNNLMQELVSEHLTDKRWREVFLLVSGLLEERSQELWGFMMQQADEFVRETPYSTKLQDFLRWTIRLTPKPQPTNQLVASRSLLLASAVNSAQAINNIEIKTIQIHRSDHNARTRISDINIASPRLMDEVSNIAIAIANASNSSVASNIFKSINNSGARVSNRTTAKAKVMDIAITIAEANRNARSRPADIHIVSPIAIAIAIASNIASTSDSEINALLKKLEELEKQLPSRSSSFDQWCAFANQLIETYRMLFHLNVVTISLEEAQALEKYLYAVKLIIDCKNAAVRVSRKEWEAIESRLLTPQGEGSQ
ncbi:TIR domain-containing protein [Leptothoe sp. EHU-05/26/07-4]